MAYDCGKPRGPIWKVAWSGVKDKWPGAYEILKDFRISNDEMSGLIVKVDLEGEKIDDVVAGWLSANESKWQAWGG
jgi:glycine betaine/proline transport system substrate-binding protein